MIKLELRYQNLTIREYTLQQGDILSIGRDPEAQIVVEESDVSRKHACIAQLENELFIWDEGSKHGTVVNDIQVICAKLNHGDVVSVGVHHKLNVSIISAEKEGTLSAVFDRQRNLMTTM